MVPEKNYQTPSKGKTSHKSSNHPSDLNEGRFSGVSEIHAYFMAPGTELPLMELKGRWNRLKQGGLENQRYQKQPFFMNETAFCLGNG